MGTTRARILVAAVAATVIGLQGIDNVTAEELVDTDTAMLGGTASATPPVQLVGGGGSFTYASSVANDNVCAMESANAPATGENEPPLPGVLDAEATTTCSAAASGTYASQACGTGVIAGSGTLSEGSGSDAYTITTFTVDFFAGVGALVGLATESEVDGGGPSPVTGLVTMTPLPQVQIPPVCAATFLVTAMVVTDA